MTGTVPNLESYIKSGFNVLLSGLHGTGKTQSLKAACKALGYTVKYYSASTLDPYTDLVGVPVPTVGEDGVQTLKMVRPREIDEADVLIFDELNRAEAKTRNAVMEIIQFRAINGEHLPNLKAVVAAVNPPDGEYDVEELDPALVDRFHVVVDVKPRVSVSYFRGIFGEAVTKVLVNWWNSHNKSKRDSYISPRRLELIGEVWVATKSVEALRAAMPPGHVFEVNSLAESLREAEMTPEQVAQLESAKAAKAAKNLEKLSKAQADAVNKVGALPAEKIRSTANMKIVADALKANPSDLDLHTKVAKAYQANVGTDRMFNTASGMEIFTSLHEAALASMTSSWQPIKKSQARTSVASFLSKNTTRKTAKADVGRIYGTIGRALKGSTANTDPVQYFISRKMAQNP